VNAVDVLGTDIAHDVAQLSLEEPAGGFDVFRTALEALEHRLSVLGKAPIDLEEREI
jgi:hypothetical protein